MRLLQAFASTLAPIYPLAKRLLYKFHGGVFPRYNKSLSARNPIRAVYYPTELILPLPQTVGEMAKSLVKVGDHVLKNQLIAQSQADANQKLVVPIHAPTSGEIIAIEARALPHASGLQELCIILKPDGKNKAIENVLQTTGTWPEDAQPLKDLIAQSGIIGMGGAGFPTYAKLPSKQGKVKHLIINGAECEPFISCDDLLMQTDAEQIWLGAQIVAHALNCQEILCGIETNKPQAIEKMQSAAKNLQMPSNASVIDLAAMKIQEVATVYPMGGQKQLVYEMTGVELQSGHHAIDQGILMMNVATLKAIYRAVTLGEPLTSRLVTVSGEGVTEGFNIEAFIGTPFNELVELAKPKGDIDYPLIMGGPMMGVQMPQNHVPILKTTNCVLANPPEPRQMQMPCIRCGECMDACPVNLLPQQMYWHAQGHEYEKVEKLNIKDCIECGCCSYVCPSHIPLVQYYRHAKSEIKVLNAEKQATELAKQRHEFKLARIEREKAEREARLKAKKEAVKKQAAQNTNTPQESEKSATSGASKSVASAAAARAAAAKAAARKKANSDTSSEQTQTDKPLSAREKAILAAQKAAANKQGQSDKDFKTKGQSLGSKSDRQAATEAAKKRAAMAAAKAKATSAAKQKAQPENSAREKAIAAARKKAAQSSKTEDPAVKSSSDLDENNNKKGNEENKSPTLNASQQTAELTTDLSVNGSETSPALEKELARKAAMQKAREAALARKKTHQKQNNTPVKTDQDFPPSKTSESSETTEAIPLDSPLDKKATAKKAAMQAAKRAAAKRAAAKKENNE